MHATPSARTAVPPHRRRLKWYAGAFIALGLIVGFFAGPRVDTTFTPRPITLGSDLERSLAESERAVGDVVPGTEKGIVWAGTPGAKTPIAIVYLPGFSATRQETFPLSDQVASRLGANLFYMRFTGQGRPGAALARMTVSDWLNEGIEAEEIGKRLGDHVVVIGSSSGGTIATWLTLHRPEALAAVVLLSPNFGPRDHRARMLTMPWGRQLAPLLFGETRHLVPTNPAEAKYWTTDYPAVALLPIMGLVKEVDRESLESIKTPMLVIYSPQDQVMDPSEIERTFGRIGSPRKSLVPYTGRSGSPHHVLAGDLEAPNDTGPVADVILAFLRDLKP